MAPKINKPPADKDRGKYFYADTEEVIEIRYDKNGNEVSREVYRRPLSDPSIPKDRILYLSAGGVSVNDAVEQSVAIIKEMEEIDKKAKRYNKKLEKTRDIAVRDSKAMATIIQKWMGTFGENNNN